MEQPHSVGRLKSIWNQANKKKLLAGGTIFLAIFALISYLLFSFPNSPNHLASNSNQGEKLSFFPVFKPEVKYGFILDTFHISNATINSNQFLSEILDEHHVIYEKIDALARNSEDVFSVTKLRAGKDYTILSKDASSPAQYFIYEPDVYSYVIYDIEKGTAEVFEREISTEIKSSSGIIKSSLWQTMVDNDLSYDLASRLEDVFGWSIDFHHVQNGDRFKVIYESRSIDGKVVGVGNILGAYYKNYHNEYHGVYFENEQHQGYYDLEGRPMKKNFLKSPVKYSRISSGFNMNRFHPVLKRRKAHLGTDYAAPYGTPILAVANGVVTKASRTRGNGNYVKIKHDKTYQTQYLHMQKFAKGISPGVHVKQGQVIGYVGSTGLATGPHVCFRFWKNNRQVNHRRLNFPPAEPMPEGDIPRFNEKRDEMVKQLNLIKFKAEPVLANVDTKNEDAKDKKERKSNP
ncbi:MAG: peptidoglycan DD-metalloendopeptidase family protein [Saprospiraceae bacterium]